MIRRVLAALILAALCALYAAILRGHVSAQDGGALGPGARESADGPSARSSSEIRISRERASDSSAPPPERVEVVARICAAEAGWTAHETGDCAAIAYLLVRRAERLGLRPRVLARRYSRRHFDVHRRDPRMWIAGLTLAGAEPRGWPRGLDWQGRYRAQWLAIVEHARGALSGDVADPCEGRADHWGMRAPWSIDWQRAIRAGWELLECGETRNAFWRVPRRGGAM